MTEVQFAKQFLTTLDSKNTKYQPDHTFDPKTFQTRVPYTLPKLSHPPHPLPPKTQQISSTPIPGSEPSTQPTQADAIRINLTLKSARNPTFTLHLPSLPSNTTIATLKSHVQSLFGETSSSPQIPTEKIKILHNKKPIPPTKPFVHDVLDSADLATTTEKEKAASTEIEFGVMIMGGAADPTPTIQTIETQTEKDRGELEKESAVQDQTVLSEKMDTHPSPQSQPVQPGGISGREVLTTAEFWDDLQGFLEQRLKNEKDAVELRALFEKAVKGS